MGLRAGLDMCGKSRLHWDSIPGPCSPYAIAIPITLPDPPLYYYHPQPNLILPSFFYFRFPPQIFTHINGENKEGIQVRLILYLSKGKVHPLTDNEGLQWE